MKKVSIIIIIVLAAIPEATVAETFKSIAVNDSSGSLIFDTHTYTNQVYAYIDPGSGSIILQIIIAGMVGISFTLKIYFKRIVEFFKGLFYKKNDNGKS